MSAGEIQTAASDPASAASGAPPRAHRPSTLRALIGNTLLVLVSIAIMVLAGEIFLRSVPRLQAQTGEGDFLFCTDSTIRHRSHPAYGYGEVPGGSYFERYNPADSWTYIHINEAGFRDNYESGGSPVLILGDSSTRGSLVNEDATFANRLDKWQPRWSFRNLGVGGFGQANSLRLYDDIAPTTPHRLVIQQYSLGTDLDDNAERAVLDGDGVRITIQPQNQARNSRPSLPVRIHKLLWEHSKLYAWFYTIAIRPHFENWDARGNIDGSLEVTRRLLVQLAERARANQADLLLLVLPAWAEMAGRSDGMEPARQRAMLEAFAAQTPGVYLLDMSPIVAVEPTDKTFGVVDKHMNDYGHFLIAQAVERWMTTQWPHGPRTGAPPRTYHAAPATIPDCAQADAYLALARQPPSPRDPER
jgi:hypothetical protein